MSGARPAAVDTHVHFWDLSRCPYPWLEAEEWDAIRSDYLPTDFVAESEGCEVEAFVHVEAGVDYDVDPVAETEWLAGLLRESPGLEMVCVGYADLRAPNLEEVIARHAEHDFFRGVRQELWFDPDSTAPGTLTTDLLADESWAAGLRKLAERDLSFDLLPSPHQLEPACKLFREVPEVAVVIDHLAVPALGADGPDPAWREGMRRFAEEVPNSSFKISGLALLDPAWTPEQMAPVVREGIEIFGPSRCMFGSNFPVDRPTTTYPDLWRVYDEITADLSESERADLFSGTARRVYRIG